MSSGFRMNIPGWAISLLFLTDGTFTTARPWKNDAGQTIDAELVAVRDDSAVLDRNGKEFVFPISKLGPDDREFIKEWQAHPPAIVPRKLTFAGAAAGNGRQGKCF